MTDLGDGPTSVAFPSRRRLTPAVLQQSLMLRFLTYAGSAVIVVAALFIAGAAWLEYRSSLNALQRQAETFVELQAQALAKPVWSLDRDQIVAQLNALVTDPHYVGATLDLSPGELALGETVTSEVLPESPEQRAAFLAEHTWTTVSEAVIYRGNERSERIGMLSLHVTRAPLVDQVRSAVLVSSGLFLGLLLVALAIIGAILLRQVMRPMRRLITTIHYVEDGDYRHVRWPHDDEIGQVFASFNELVDSVRANAQTQARLAESEERYALALEGTHDGIWDWNRLTEDMYLSPRWKQLLGYTDGEIPNAFDSWIERIHPADQQRFKDALAAHLEGQSDYFAVEHRMRHRDGAWRWMLGRGKAVWDSQGRPTRVAGSLVDIHDRKALEEQLLHNALHDELTGLPNRALLLDRIDMALQRLRQDGESDHGVAVLFIDLDRFQIVNDSLGHFVGDELLIAVANRLITCARTTDTVARLGGDEFAVLLEGYRIDAAAEGLAGRIQQSLRHSFEVAEREIYTTASMGIAFANDSHESGVDILRDGDTAMYEAKGEGRDRYAVFKDHARRRAVRILELDTALRNAIDREEIEPHFQPIIDLATGKTAGFEALARWNDPERGLIPPSEFIPLAEETGLIGVIGRQILRKSVIYLRNWQAISSDLYMAVNTSPQQWLEHDFAREIQEAITANDLTPENLRLEITESGMMRDVDRMSDALHAGATHGVKLLIDDFGTGHSSLAELLRMPFSGVKIDKSFVHQTGRRDLAQPDFIGTILALARSSHMFVVSEGVETLEQAQALSELGCEFAQGYVYSKPRDAEGIEDYLLAELDGASRWAAAS